jgi:hypothetical protein
MALLAILALGALCTIRTRSIFKGGLLTYGLWVLDTFLFCLVFPFVGAYCLKQRDAFLWFPEPKAVIFVPLLGWIYAFIFAAMVRGLHVCALKLRGSAGRAKKPPHTIRRIVVAGVVCGLFGYFLLYLFWIPHKAEAQALNAHFQVWTGKIKKGMTAAEVTRVMEAPPVNTNYDRWYFCSLPWGKTHPLQLDFFCDFSSGKVAWCSGCFRPDQ